MADDIRTPPKQSQEDELNGRICNGGNRDSGAIETLRRDHGPRRPQTLSVAVTLTWLLLVEAMVVSFAPGLGRWLPGGTAGAMSGAATYSNLLPVGAAAFLFAGYGLAFAAAGSRFVLRRDIT